MLRAKCVYIHTEYYPCRSFVLAWNFQCDFHMRIYSDDVFMRGARGRASEDFASRLEFNLRCGKFKTAAFCLVAAMEQTNE